MKPVIVRMSIALLLPGLLLVAAGAQEPIKRDLALFTNEQQTVTPGYPIGNVALGDPTIADFKVMPGRRDLLLLGKGVGQTTLMVWDQANVKRHEFLVAVNTRKALTAETELQTLLKDFPSVTLTRLAGSLVVSGVVTSEDDLTAVEKIAAAAEVKSVVRYAAEATGTPTSNMPKPSTGRSDVPGAPLSVPATTRRVHYDIEALEASVKFSSGSYATGIEPSGRSLFKGVVDMDLNQEGEIFIGGVAADPKGGAKNTKTADEAGEQSGLRLKLRPTAPDKSGRFKTFVLVETNLPIGSDKYDPAIWRRARWEFSAVSGEPFGITGGDLMATPDMANSGSALGTATSTASVATRVPGSSKVPGLQYVPIFGSLFGSRSYKGKTTQLLVVLRPRIVNPAR
jgi:hypothetical protein